ncbi:MAG TPA: M48 family metalloprotease [Candidatus Eisenbacteria bacterium]|nr:M48 family metalloprotease [Candidatus Eisenbacteria bacterium]
MEPIRIASLPAVRRKRRADLSYAAAHLAAVTALAACSWILHPLAGMAVALMVIVRVATIVLNDLEDHIGMARGVVPVTERSQCPVLWDAARECCAAAGMRPVRLYLFEPGVKLPAASWGFLSRRSLGMSRTLIGRFQPEWVRATVAHEVAHHAMGDLRASAATKVLEWALRDAVFILLIASLWTFVSGTPASLGRIACAAVAAGAALIAGEAAQALWKPHLRYAREFAADSLGVALTGDAIGAMGLLLYLAVASGSLSQDPEPRPGRSHPPPLVRIKKIAEDNLRTSR